MIYCNRKELTPPVENVKRVKSRTPFDSYGHHAKCSTSITIDTVSPLYTETRYNDKNRYNDNLTSTETLSQEVIVNKKIMREHYLVFNTPSNICFGYL